MSEYRSKGLQFRNISIGRYQESRVKSYKRVSSRRAIAKRFFIFR